MHHLLYFKAIEVQCKTNIFTRIQIGKQQEVHQKTRPSRSDHLEFTRTLGGARTLAQGLPFRFEYSLKAVLIVSPVRIPAR